MSKNIFQVYTDNPIVTNQGTDLMYFGRAPYGLGDDTAMQFSDFAAQFGAPFTPAAMTKVDDTNVTLTLGGTPATSLLQAVSLTLGWTGELSPVRGGTGVNNGTNTLTLGGTLTTSGAFNSTFTMTGATSVTFPTSGTLATTSQLPSPAALTKTDDTNVTLTLGGTPATSLLQAVSLTMGWTGTLATGRGGTGLNTYTTNGILYATSASVLSQISTANNSVLATNGSGVPAFTTSLPTAVQVAVGSLNSGISASSSTFWRGDGTWATPSSSGTVSSGTINQLAWYAATGTTVSGLATANNGILVTSSGGVPSISNTVGAGLTMPSITFNSTTGIVGTTTNNSAAAGSVGEFVTSNVAYASRINLTSGVATNVTSISLTAGDWDVWGNVNFTPAGTTSVNYTIGWISTTSATIPDNSLYTGEFLPPNSVPGLIVNGDACPTVRISLSGTTTVYLSGQSGFAIGPNAFCGTISARRVR